MIRDRDRIYGTTVRVHRSSLARFERCKRSEIGFRSRECIGSDF
jgi:hypothetical protein